MDTLEHLHRKIEGAEQLKSVVRTMKAMAASNIGQYEMAVNSLEEYYRTVALGIIAYFREAGIEEIDGNKESQPKEDRVICAIVFGSDQGLVGQFNDSLSDFVSTELNAIQGKKEIWAVGERVSLLTSDLGFVTSKQFSIPNSVTAINPLVGKILASAEESHEKRGLKEFFIFHNEPKSPAGYFPASSRLLPLDEKWRQGLMDIHWPTKILPQIAGGHISTIRALVREYLFMSLFKACAESLASENASRLAAMQRAEKKIGELLGDLNHNFHNLRQTSIDEELFDVVAGFEALKK